MIGLLRHQPQLIQPHIPAVSKGVDLAKLGKLAQRVDMSFTSRRSLQTLSSWTRHQSLCQPASAMAPLRTSLTFTW